MGNHGVSCVYPQSQTLCLLSIRANPGLYIKKDSSREYRLLSNNLSSSLLRIKKNSDSFEIEWKKEEENGSKVYNEEGEEALKSRLSRLLTAVQTRFEKAAKGTRIVPRLFYVSWKLPLWGVEGEGMSYTVGKHKNIGGNWKYLLEYHEINPFLPGVLPTDCSPLSLPGESRSFWGNFRAAN